MRFFSMLLVGKKPENASSNRNFHDVSYECRVCAFLRVLFRVFVVCVPVDGGEEKKSRLMLKIILANYFISSLSLSTVMSASLRMLFRSFGCSIFSEWCGTVTLFPSLFLYILWLLLWRTRINPCFCRTLIILLAGIRGSLSLIRSLPARSD